MISISDFIRGDAFLMLVFVLAVLAFLRRLMITYKYQYTIRTRHDNMLIAIAIFMGVLYYAVVNFTEGLHSYFSVLLRIAFAWLFLVEYWIGGNEISRRQRGRALITIARELEGVTVNVIETDCGDEDKILADLDRQNG